MRKTSSHRPLRRLNRIAIAIIALATVVGIVVGYFYGQSVPYRYKIEAQVLAQIGRETGSARPEIVGTGGSGAMVGAPRSEQINTEVALLQSPALIKQTLDELAQEIPGFGDAPKGPAGPMAVLSSGLRNLAENLKLTQARTQADRMLEAWMNAVDVTAVPRSNVMTVQCNALDPQIGQRFVERWLRLYERKHIEAYSQAETTPLFEIEAKRLREEVETTEHALTDLRLSTQVFDVDATKSQLLNRHLSALGSLQNLKGQAAGLEAKIKELGTRLQETPEQTLVQSDSRANEMRDYVARLVLDAEKSLAQLQSQYDEGDPAVKAASAELERLRASLESQPLVRDEARTTGRNPLTTSLQQDLAKTSAELQANKAESAVLEATIRELAAQLVDVEKTRARHEVLARRLSEAKTSLSQVLEGERVGRINTTLDQALVTNVRVISEPLVPTSPIKMLGLPHRVALVLGGGMLGFLMALGYYLVRQAMYDAGLLVGPAAQSAASDVIVIGDDMAHNPTPAKSDAS